MLVRPAMHLPQPLRSIRARIVAGFCFVLVLLAAITAEVWQAGDELDRALARDTASQVTESRINDLQAALSDARLRVVGYLQTEDAAAHQALEHAIDRLQAAANVPGQDGAFSSVRAAIAPVREALAGAADVIAQRHSAVAALVAASAASLNSVTAFAASTSRTDDPELAEAGAAVMADVARAGTTAARASVTEDHALFDSARAAIEHAKSVLQQLTQADESWRRVRRLANVVDGDLDEMQVALTAVQTAVAARNERLARLDSVVTHAGTAGSIAILVATADQRAHRAAIQLAQRAMQGAIMWTAIAASTLGLAIAVGLGFSITRRVRRLVGAVRGLAEGELDTTVPGVAARDELGAVAGAISLFKERTLEQRTALSTRLEAALNNMRQGLFMLDDNGRLTVLNRRLAAMFGLDDQASLVEATLNDLVEAVVRQGGLSREVAEPLFLLPEAPEDVAASTSDLQDGRTVTVSRQHVENDGWVVTYDDITERRRAEARMEHMARHDALTGLPNRTLFQIHLERDLARISRNENCAVILLDLDDFKTVNDTLGHQTGDILLQAVAGRLVTVMRESDFVARLGGDEFAIIQSRVDQPQNARALAQRVMETIAAPYEIGEHNLVVGVSLGIALAPMDGRGCDDILKSADLALYRAKAEGRGTYSFFEPRMNAEIRQRRQLEIDLRNALINNELTVYYQPLVNLGTGKVVSFEALVRWRHPSRGLVLPDSFIALAEEVGLIIPIGEQVMRLACQDATGWPTEIRLALNVSVAQFRSAQLIDTLLHAVQLSGFDPSRLDIEITESVLMRDTQATLVKLQRLRDLGMRIVMDDFGTGYSSLSYLRSFPIDKLKIDQCFLRDIDTDGSAKAIVRAVVHLGRALGIPVVAEGVETEEQFGWLRAEGCSEGQGFLLSRPCAAESVMETIEQINRSSETRGGSELAVAAARPDFARTVERSAHSTAGGVG
jgi:diguanylate cyclase (GGDEF)-like protein